MNAHISRDLPYVVAELTPKSTTAIDPDYTLVSRIIEQISAPALDQIAARFDPTLRTAEIPLQLGGRLALGQLVALWRTQSWARGIALRDAAASARPAIQRQIETSAAARATAILAATSYLPLIQSSQNRDAYCQAHHG